MNDFRYAVRQFVRAPAFAVVAVLTLALGIGANTALFSFLNAVFVRPLPGIIGQDRLVWIEGVVRPQGRQTHLSFPTFQDIATQGRSFASLAAFADVPVALGSGGEPERVQGQLVSGSYFAVLGVSMAAGRAFLPEEDGVPMTHPVAVVSHGLWQRRFGGDPAIGGRSIVINGRPFTIVGVAPARFNGADLSEPRDIWIPLAMQPALMPRSADMLTRRGDWWLRAIGRLAPTASREGASVELRTIAARLTAQFPALYERFDLDASSVRGGLVPGDGAQAIPIALLALGVTGIVLLITCANVANLLLARATSRQREVGIRLALGATRQRLVRQLLTESVLLALLGATGGLLVASWSVDLFMVRVPFTLDASLDLRVLIVSCLLAVSTGVLFGLAPALEGTRLSVAASVRDAVVGRGVRRARLQRGFVIAQVALSLVLLVAAGLFVRSLAKTTGADPGYDASARVAAASFDITQLGYAGAREEAFYADVLARAAALPGVESASLSNLAPMSGRLIGGEAFVSSDSGGEARQIPGTVFQSLIYPRYFATIALPLLRGRDVTMDDRVGAPPVVIINEALAERAWPGQDPLGRRLRLSARGREVLVIGVARNAQYDELGEDPRPYVYLPARQTNSSFGEMSLLVRSAGDATPLLPALRRELQALDAHLPVYRVATLDQYLRERFDGERLGSVLLSIFGGLALVLSAVGVYGVLAYAVAQRRREIGVRVALGARQRDVLALFIGEGVRLALIGVGVGLLLAFGATRLLSAMLYGITPTDALTFVAGSALLAGTAVLASWIPARRAARVDPMVALRSD